MIFVTFGTIFFVHRTFSVWSKSWERQDKLSHVPTELIVSEILYSNEELYGLGPGGNETGIIVYKIPNDTVKEIELLGIDYFTRLLPNSGSRYEQRGQYSEWQETPISSDPDWKDKVQTQTPDSVVSPPKLADYLDRYGWEIKIEPEIEQEINEAVSSPGSYFAYSRAGMLIVIPSIEKAVYVYSG